MSKYTWVARIIIEADCEEDAFCQLIDEGLNDLNWEIEDIED